MLTVASAVKEGEVWRMFRICANCGECSSDRIEYVLTAVGAVQTREDGECSGYVLTMVSAVKAGEGWRMFRICANCCECSSDRRGW